MKNKISFFFLGLGLISVLSAGIYGCKKDGVVTANKEVAFFSVPGASDIYRVTGPTVTYKIPVGLTKIPEGSRTVAVSIVSPSGAASPAQYSINKTSFTFDANHIIDTMIVSGVFTEYQGGRKDTLKFSFTNPSDGIPTLKNSFQLVLRGPCLEEDIAFADLLGDYQTYEDGSYGPYVSTITAASAVSATSSKATISNIFEQSIAAEAIFTYDTPGNFTVTIASQGTQYTSGGLPLMVRTASPGTFQYCSQSFSLPMELYTSAKTVALWTMTMSR